MGNSRKREILFIYLVAIYSGLVVLAGPLAAKLVNIFGLVAPAGFLSYSISFLISDVVAEIYGKDEAHRLVKTGLLLIVISMVLTYIARILPGANEQASSAFNVIFGSTLRIYIASIAAFAVSQTHDVVAFLWWKKKTNGKHLWLRNNASTLVSQFLDTVIFITIAFYGVFPVWPIILGQYVIKVIVALLDTPFCYLAVHLVKRYINGQKVN